MHTASLKYTELLIAVEVLLLSLEDTIVLWFVKIQNISIKKCSFSLFSIVSYQWVFNEALFIRKYWFLFVRKGPIWKIQNIKTDSENKLVNLREILWIA